MNDDLDTLIEHLELVAAWRKPGGPTPKQPQPNTHKVALKAAATIRDLRDRLGEIAKAEKLYRHSHDLFGTYIDS